jgi:hypothetical protein
MNSNHFIDFVLKNSTIH